MWDAGGEGAGGVEVPVSVDTLPEDDSDADSEEFVATPLMDFSVEMAVPIESESVDE